MMAPILLYRYLNAQAALKSIESQSFKVGRIRDFNDPFEWRPGLTGYSPSGEGLAHTFIEKFLDRIHNMHGILCFSDTFRQPVLWSHYADKHRGVAFEVEYRNDPERVIKMKYTDERPVVDVRRIKEVEYLKSQLNRLIFQKSTGWSYENEYRVFIRLRDCRADGEWYFRPIEMPTEDILLKRVILGFGFHQEEAVISNALRAGGFSRTQVSRAKMCQNSYEIEC